jgi:transcriptional regulator with PAS, ATPase and Fis domain
MEHQMNNNFWVKEFSGAITVCDADGLIVEMNDQAVRAFQDEGGIELLGSNLLDCHPEPARSKLSELMKKRQTNVYTIEKNKARKLIYQTPWYHEGRYGGFMELSIVIPDALAHFKRD